MTTRDLRHALTCHFVKFDGTSPWMFGDEVRYASDDGEVIRRADALAFNTQSGELHGFEIKVSRIDWLNELANPGKCAPIMRYCDRWWLVAPEDGDVVRAGELPPTWGLMVQRHESLSLHVRTDAPRLKPITPDPRLLLALMKKAHASTSLELGEMYRAYHVSAQLTNAIRTLIDIRYDEREPLAAALDGHREVCTAPKARCECMPDVLRRAQELMAAQHKARAERLARAQRGGA